MCSFWVILGTTVEGSPLAFIQRVMLQRGYPPQKLHGQNSPFAPVCVCTCLQLCVGQSAGPEGLSISRDVLQMVCRWFKLFYHAFNKQVSSRASPASPCPHLLSGHGQWFNPFPSITRDRKRTHPVYFQRIRVHRGPGQPCHRCPANLDAPPSWVPTPALTLNEQPKSRSLSNQQSWLVFGKKETSFRKAFPPRQDSNHSKKVTTLSFVCMYSYIYIYIYIHILCL